MTLSFYSDLPKEAFTIPFLNISIYFYSIFFAFGFLLAYWLILRLIKHSPYKVQNSFIDALCLYMFTGTLLGARLGHVLFYDLDYYLDNPIEIFLLRKGGLASHGAAIGILCSLFLFNMRHVKKTKLPFLQLTDWLSVGALFAGGMIRIGNFFNQEILGKPSDLPWAVVFSSPSQDIVMPCHPVQLYEALFCFIFGIILYFSVKKSKKAPGFYTGAFFFYLFLFRFCIEFLKVAQESYQTDFLNMGQLLSIPFIFVGAFLCYKKLPSS